MRQQTNSFENLITRRVRADRLRRFVAMLSAFVLLTTMNTLKLNADTLERIATCGIAQHVHDESCYDADGELACGLEEHVHTDACYQQRPTAEDKASTRIDGYVPLDAQVRLASPVEFISEDEDTAVEISDVDDAVDEVMAELQNGDADDRGDEDDIDLLFTPDDEEALPVSGEDATEIDDTIFEVEGEEDTFTEIGSDDAVEMIDAPIEGEVIEGEVTEDESIEGEVIEGETIEVETTDEENTKYTYELGDSREVLLSTVLEALGIQLDQIDSASAAKSDEAVLSVALNEDGDYVITALEGFEKGEIVVVGMESETVAAYIIAITAAKAEEETEVGEADKAEEAPEIKVEEEATEEKKDAEETVEEETEKAEENAEEQTEVEEIKDEDGVEEVQESDEESEAAEVAIVENDNVTIVPVGDNSLSGNLEIVYNENVNKQSVVDRLDAILSGAYQPGMMSTSSAAMSGRALAGASAGNETAGQYSDYAVFDISLLDDGVQRSETGEVGVVVRPENVNIYDNLPGNATATNVEYTLYHIHNSAADTLPVSVDCDEDGSLLAVDFTTDSFSYFVLKYTVDYEIIKDEIKVNVNFQNVVENGVDFGETAILSAVDEGVALNIAQLEAGFTSDDLADALSIDYIAAVNGDGVAQNPWDQYEVVSVDPGLEVADGEIRVTADGTVVLSDGVSTINIVITGYQASVQKVLGDGATIEALNGELPMGASAEYKDLSDKADELADKYGLTNENAVEGFSAFDVGITTPSGEYDAEGSFAVTVSHEVAIPEGAKVELFHIHEVDGEKQAELVENATVEDGRVSFVTDGFSEYVVRYTVDFEYNGFTFSITGGSELLLSQLFALLHIDRDVADVEDVTFSDAELVVVEKTEDDWKLISLKAFSSEETLTVSFKDGTELVIDVTDLQYTTNLSDVLTDVTINGAEWDPATESHTVKPGKEYSLTMTFQEGEGNGQYQFANSGWMSMPIPDGMTFKTSNTFSMSVNEAGDNFTISGNDIIVEGGQLKIRFNESDPNYQKLKDITTAKFTVNLTGLFSPNYTEYIIDGKTDTDIKVDTTPDVTVNKTGSVTDWNSDDNYATVKYRLEVKANGTATGVQILDTIQGTGLSIDTGSITITESGTTVSGWTTNATGTSINMTTGTLEDGKTYVVEYTAKLQKSALEANGDGSYSIDANNKVDWTGDKTTTHDLQHVVNRPNIQKNATGSTQSGNVTTTTWTIEADSAYGEDNQLKNITDRLGSAGMSYDETTPIHVVVTDPYTHAVVKEQDIAWNQVTKTADSWTYDFSQITPNQNKQYHYTITYKTKYDIGNATEGTNIKNEWEDGHDHSGESWANVQPNPENRYGLWKEYTGKELSGTNTVVTWKVHVTVPASGVPADKAVLVETLPYTNQYQDTFVSYEGAEGLYDSEHGGTESVAVDATSQAPGKVLFTFMKDGTNAGLNASTDGKARDIVLTLKTQCDPAWLADDEAELTHTNHAEFNGHEANAYFTPDKPYIKKSGYSDGKADDLPKYTFGVTVGVFSDDLFANPYPGTTVVKDSNGKYVIIEDDYDDRLAYIDGSATVGGGDQYSQEGHRGTAGLDVDTTTKPGKIIFKLYKDSLARNGENLYQYYNVRYSMKVKDVTTLNAMRDEAIATGKAIDIGNSVTGFGRHDITVKYEPKILDKSHATVDGKLVFTIKVNEEGLALSDNGVLVLNDDMTNLSVRYQDISIAVEGDKTVETTDSDGNPVTAPYFNMKGNRITFYLPDAAPVTITYRATPRGEVGSDGNITYSNTVKLKGFEETDGGTEQYTSEASGYGTNYAVYIFKADGLVNSNALAGAVFKVYEVDEVDANGDIVSGTPMKKSDGTDFTVTTSDGKDGSQKGLVRVMGTDDLGWNLKPEKRYYLMEVKAPEGYALDNTKYSFTISKDGYVNYTSSPVVAPDGSGKLVQAWTYHNGDVMTVKNYRKDGVITLEKGFTGNIDPDHMDDDQKAAIKFQIYTIDETAGTETLWRTVTYDQFTKVEDKYTYTIGDLPEGKYKVVESVDDVTCKQTVYAITDPDAGAAANNESDDKNGRYATIVISEDDVTNHTENKVSVTNNYDIPSEFKIYKHAEGEASYKLAGAKFGVFAVNASNEPEGTALATYETNSRGRFVILQNDSTAGSTLPTYNFGQVYALKETEAPTGFLLNDTVTYFCFVDETHPKPASVPAGTVEIAYQTSVEQPITDAPKTTSLEATKVYYNEMLEEDDGEKVGPIDVLIKQIASYDKAGQVVENELSGYYKYGSTTGPVVPSKATIYHIVKDGDPAKWHLVDENGVENGKLTGLPTMTFDNHIPIYYTYQVEEVNPGDYVPTYEYTTNLDGSVSAKITNKPDTNTPVTKVKARKKWVNVEGQDITSSMGLDDGVSVDVYRYPGMLTRGTIIEANGTLRDPSQQFSVTFDPQVSGGTVDRSIISCLPGDRIRITIKPTAFSGSNTFSNLNSNPNLQTNWDINNLGVTITKDDVNGQFVAELNASSDPNYTNIRLTNLSDVTAYTVIFENINAEGRTQVLTQADLNGMIGEAQYKETLELNKANGWSNTSKEYVVAGKETIIHNENWIETKTVTYSYFIVEPTGSNFEASYTVDGDVTTVTNIDKKLGVDKTWFAANGKDDITNSKENGTVTYTIKRNVYETPTPQTVTVDYSQLYLERNGSQVPTTNVSIPENIKVGSTIKVKFILANDHSNGEDDPMNGLETDAATLGGTVLSDSGPITINENGHKHAEREYQILVTDSTVNLVGTLETADDAAANGLRVEVNILKEPSDIFIPGTEDVPVTSGESVGTVTVGYDRIVSTNFTDENIKAAPGSQPWSVVINKLPGTSSAYTYTYYVEEEVAASDDFTLVSITPSQGTPLGGKVQVVNKLKPGYLNVKKVVQGAKPVGKVYEIAVMDSDGNYYKPNGESNGTTPFYVQVPADDPDGVTWNPLTPGNFTVMEKDASADGYTWTVSGTGSVKVEQDKTTDTTVTNSYFKDTHYTPQITKALKVGDDDVNPWPDSASFDFYLSFDSENSTAGLSAQDYKMNNREAQATKDAKTASFGKIDFKKPGTYAFTIEEVEPAGTNNHKRNGIVYSTDKVTLTVVVAEKAGEPGVLEVTSHTYNGEESGIITNTLDYPTYAPSVTKQLLDDGQPAADEDWQDKSFTFDLTNKTTGAGAANVIMPGTTEKTVTASSTDHKETFDAIAFKAAGTYTFTVKERQGNDTTVTYNTAEKTIVVEVGADGDGNLSITKVTVDDVEKTGEAIIGSGVTVDNDLVKTAELTVTKNLSKANTSGEDLSFYVGLFTDSQGTILATPADVGGANPQEVKVLKNESSGTVTFSGLTIGTEYYVFETNASGVKVLTTDKVSGYAIKASDVGGQKVTIAPSNNTASITNDYSASGTAQFSAKKASNDTLGDRKFTFVQEAPDGTKTVSGEVTAGNSVSFPEISFDYADLGPTGTKDYVYKIYETIPGNAVKEGEAKPYSEATDKTGTWVANGVSYDGTIHSVTIKVTDNGDGTLTVKYNGSDTFTTPEFTNSYEATGTGSLQGTKELNGGTLAAGTFSFIATADASNLPVDATGWHSAPSNEAGGRIDFGSLTFNQVGTWKYTIKENTTTQSDDTIYDLSEYEVTFKTTDNGDGTLSVAKTIKKVKDANGSSIDTAAQATQNDITVSFTNVKKGALKVKKNVTVNGQETTTQLADGTYNFTLTKKDDSSFQQQTITVTVSGGQSAYSDPVENLVPGTYVVTETPNQFGTTLTERNGGTNSGDNAIEIEVAAGETAEQNVAEFTNDKTVEGKITIKKSVTITPTDKAKTSYQVTVKNGEGKYVSFNATSNKYEVIESNEDIYLDVPVNETGLVIEGLPIDTYTVTEYADGAQIDGYTLSAESVTNGTAALTITDNEKEVGLNNTYTRDEGELKIKKTGTVNGATDTEGIINGDYSFTVAGKADTDTAGNSVGIKITLANGVAIAAEKVGTSVPADVTVVFAEGIVTLGKLPTGSYIVTENLTAEQTNAGIHLLANNDIEISVTKEPETIPTAEFENTKSEKGKITVNKSVLYNGVADTEVENKTITVGLYKDEAAAQPVKHTVEEAEVNWTETITLNGSGTGTATFSELDYDTYYVFELGDDGASVKGDSGTINGVAYKVGYNGTNGPIALSHRNPEGTVNVTNEQTETGSLKVTKALKKDDGEDLTATKAVTFQVGLYKQVVTTNDDTTTTTWEPVKDPADTSVNWVKDITVPAGESANTAEVKFDGLTIGKTYRVYELTDAGAPVEADGHYKEYTVTYGNADGVEITRTAKDGETALTNTVETTTIKATKVWQPKPLPADTSVEVTLSATVPNDNVGEDPVPVTIADLTSDDAAKTITGDASVQWTDLPKYHDGKEVAYTVEETKVTIGGVEKWKKTDGTTNPYLTGSNTVNGETTFTNEYSDVYVQKRFSHESISIANWIKDYSANKNGVLTGTGISKIYFQLQKKNGESWVNVNEQGLPGDQVITLEFSADNTMAAVGEYAEGETTYIATGDDLTWIYKLTGLPKGEYQAIEVTKDGAAIPSDLGVEYCWEPGPKITVIKNILKKITAQKVWDDKGNTVVHPEITFELYMQKGEDAATRIAEKTITDSDLSVTWQYLPEYDFEEGKKITYYVKEVYKIPATGVVYKTSISGNVETMTSTEGGTEVVAPVVDDTYGAKITNAHVAEVTFNNAIDTVEMHVNKHWNRIDGSSESPNGAQITLTIYKVKGGTETEYTKVTLNGVAEDETAKAATEAVGTEGQDGYKAAEAAKEAWSAVGNSANAFEITPWHAWFRNLPKYDDDGTELSYRVKETGTWPGYVVVYGNNETATYVEMGGSNTDITNREEPGTLTGTKTWNTSRGHTDPILKLTRTWDGHTEPEVVKGSGEGNRTYNMSGSADLQPVWNDGVYTYSDLPKYTDDGKEYTYAVVETGFTVTVDEKTFTYTVDGTNVTVSPTDNAPKFSVTQPAAGSNDIVNTELTESSVKKTWSTPASSETVEPDFITYKLTRTQKVGQDGQEEPDTAFNSSDDYTVTITRTNTGYTVKVGNAEAVPYTPGSWNYTWSDLPAYETRDKTQTSVDPEPGTGDPIATVSEKELVELTYTWKETRFGFDGVIYKVENGTVSVVTEDAAYDPGTYDAVKEKAHTYWMTSSETNADDPTITEITNTLDETYLDIVKLWSLNGNTPTEDTEDDINEISFYLYRSDNKIVDSVTKVAKSDKQDETHPDGAQPFKITREGVKGTGKWELHIDGLEKTGETGAYTYWIQEVTVPGYVTTPKIVVVTEDPETLEESETEINSGSKADPQSEIRIVNSKYNVSLPSTGGPGTTMFYVLGSILTLLAAVLLITKKRSDATGIE